MSSRYSVSLVINAITRGAVRSVRELGSLLTSTGQRAASRIGSSISGAFRGVFGVLTSAKTQLAGLVGAAGLGALTASVAKDTAAWTRRAKEIDFNIDRYNALRNTYAKLNGFESQAFDEALRTFSEYLGDAANGGGPLLEILQGMGLEAKELAEIPLDEALEKFAQKYKDLRVADRTFVDQSIFGSDGDEMRQALINLGNDGFDPLIAKTKEYGLALSNADIQGMRSFSKSIKDIKASISGFATELASVLAPILSEISTRFAKLIRGRDIKSQMNTAVDAVLNGVANILEGIEAAYNKGGGRGVLSYLIFGADGGTSLFQKVQGQIDFLKEQLSKLPGVNIQTKADKAQANIDKGQGLLNQIDEAKKAIVFFEETKAKAEAAAGGTLDAQVAASFDANISARKQVVRDLVKQLGEVGKESQKLTGRSCTTNHRALKCS